MPARLSFWICAAIAVTTIAGVLVVGTAWGALIAVLHVPQVLAVLLLSRAIVQALRRQPWALRVGSREVLGGASGFVVPFVFVLALTLLRETGMVSMRLERTQSATNHTTTSIGWQDEDADASLLRSGLAVQAPAGPLGDAFAQQLGGEWLRNDRRLYGAVTLKCDAPFAIWPLVKSSTVKAHVDVRLQLRSDAPGTRARTATIAMDVTHSSTMFGIASRRDFLDRIGVELGRMTRDAIDKHLAKSDDR